MRKGLWLALILSLVMGAFFAPEAAARERRSKVINVYWHDKEQVSEDVFRLTTWYVGVYAHEDGTWSDLYESVDRCRKTDGGRMRCRQERYRIGISDLEGDTFEMETRNLESAHLDAVYKLRTYDRNGNRVGERVPTHIVADLAGRGDIRRYGDSYTRRYGWANCSFVRTTYDSRFRKAVATGSIDAADIGTIDLGSTRDAFLETSTSRVLRHSC